MSKASFRALREQAGHSQQSLADELGVNVKLVKRWEHEGSPAAAPSDAWDLLLDCLETQRRIVSCSLEKVGRAVEEAGADPDTVSIAYYSDQAMYEAFGRDGGYFGVANANARAAGEALAQLGFDVEYRYPGEGAISAPGGRY